MSQLELYVQIFAPLARLLGLYSVKEELEQLAFKYSNPEAYSQMMKRLETLASDQRHTIQAVRTFLWSCRSPVCCS